MRPFHPLFSERYSLEGAVCELCFGERVEQSRPNGAFSKHAVSRGVQQWECSVEADIAVLRIPFGLR